MRKIPLLFFFFVALFFTFFGTAFFTQVPFLPFSPFLAVLYYRTSFLTALWIASCSGLLVDFVSSEMVFGKEALNFCCTTLLLYKQKRHFFEDKVFAVCCFTAIVSLFSSSIDFAFFSLFQDPLPLFLSSFFDFLIPTLIINAMYAFCCFSLPFFFYRILRQKRWRSLFSKFDRTTVR